MPRQDQWTRKQLLVALKLYCELPFGRMHSKNPEIIRYAKMIGRTPSALAMKLTNFASLDPAIRASGRSGLSGASRQDKEIWEEMTSNWQILAEEVEQIRLDDDRSSPVEAAEMEPDSYEGFTKSSHIEVRLRQGFFRQAVLSAYEYKCCISGLPVRELLVASHIVPWRSNKSNRLNPRNGLCLSVIHDRSFDLGLLTLSEDLRIVLSRKIQRLKASPYIDNTFRVYEGQPIHLPRKFSPAPEFLRYHRTHIFCE
jgi:predicted restriction endonuclease